MSYRQVNSSLWTGDVARALRGNMDGWTVANYILHGPESCTSSIGVFHLSLAALSDAIGLPMDRLSIAVRSVTDTGFAAYDETYRMWIVFEVARHRYGEAPSLTRKEVKGLVAALPRMMSVASKSFVWKLLRERYAGGWDPIFEAAGIEPLTAMDRLSIADRTPIDTGIREEGRKEEGKEENPLPPSGGIGGNGSQPSKASQDFDRFLALMPKGTRARQGQAAARKLWEKLKAADRDIDEALAWAQVAVRSEQWTKEGGQYVPALARIIREKRWKDGAEAFTRGRPGGRAGAVMVRRDEAADELRRQRQKGPQNVS